MSCVVVSFCFERFRDTNATVSAWFRRFWFVVLDFHRFLPKMAIATFWGNVNRCCAGTFAPLFIVSNKSAHFTDQRRRKRQGQKVLSKGLSNNLLLRKGHDFELEFSAPKTPLIGSPVRPSSIERTPAAERGQDMLVRHGGK